MYEWRAVRVSSGWIRSIEAVCRQPIFEFKVAGQHHILGVNGHVAQLVRAPF